MKRSFYVVGAAFAFVLAFLMSTGMLVDGQYVWLGVTGSILYLGYWAVLIANFKEDMAILSCSCIIWGLSLLSGIFLVLTRTIGSGWMVFISLLAVPYSPLALLPASIYYMSSVAKFVSSALIILIPILILAEIIFFIRKYKKETIL